jgi:transcriptional regulator with XRE-family HTH domain
MGSTSQNFEEPCQGVLRLKLATRMGVDQGYISSLEAGKRNPTVVTLWHTAVALGVTPDRFLKQRAK